MFDCLRHITELHSAIFIAIKLPVATGRNWPIFACHAAIFTVKSMYVSGLIPDSWALVDAADEIVYAM